MRLTLLAAAFLTIMPTAFAQNADHAGHAAPSAAVEPATAGAAASPALADFEAANARMHEGMAVELTGDADIDFVRSMIPHHQGAIDMARIVLEHGKDPELRALAEEILTAQEREIAEMERWLEENAPNVDPDGAPAQ